MTYSQTTLPNTNLSTVLSYPRSVLWLTISRWLFRDTNGSSDSCVRTKHWGLLKMRFTHYRNTIHFLIFIPTFYYFEPKTRPEEEVDPLTTFKKHKCYFFTLVVCLYDWYFYGYLLIFEIHTIIVITNRNVSWILLIGWI